MLEPTQYKWRATDYSYLIKAPLTASSESLLRDGLNVKTSDDQQHQGEEGGSHVHLHHLKNS